MVLSLLIVIMVLDEQTVRLWLKDHQDAAQRLAEQQNTTFQEQFNALRAELQTATNLLQARHGVGLIRIHCFHGLCAWTCPNFREMILNAGYSLLMNIFPCSTL